MDSDAARRQNNSCSGLSGNIISSISQQSRISASLAYISSMAFSVQTNVLSLPRRSRLCFSPTPSLPMPPRASLLAPRDYIDTVCKPAPEHPTDLIPPCSEIENIETACQPNGTAALYLAAHQECMCGGSFFVEWSACLACQTLHRGCARRVMPPSSGGCSRRASSAFCGTATPTAVWASIFASQEAAATPLSTGDTVSSDHAPSQTAISLYYTPSGSQGPGPITGSAADCYGDRPEDHEQPVHHGPHVEHRRAQRYNKRKSKHDDQAERRCGEGRFRRGSCWSGAILVGRWLLL